jgi:hypothetical protein
MIGHHGSGRMAQARRRLALALQAVKWGHGVASSMRGLRPHLGSPVFTGGGYSGGVIAPRGHQTRTCVNPGRMRT